MVLLGDMLAAAAAMRGREVPVTDDKWREGVWLLGEMEVVVSREVWEENEVAKARPEAKVTLRWGSSMGRGGVVVVVKGSLERREEVREEVMEEGQGVGSSLGGVGRVSVSSSKILARSLVISSSFVWSASLDLAS